MSVAWVGVAVAAYSAYSSSEAAGDAADQQAQSGRDSNDLSERQFQQTRADNAGIRARGESAGNQLSYLMGLDSGAGGAGGENKTAEQLRAQLVGQYTTRGTPAQGRVWNYGEGGDGGWNMPEAAPGTPDSINEAGLNADIQSRLATQQVGVDKAATDPAYGSLSRRFGLADFDQDPGRGLRLSEGNKNIENSAAARGGVLSGATLKAMARFGQDFASQEYGKSYDRFNNDQTTKYNRLAGIAGSGQQATNNVNAAGEANASRQGNTLQDVANVQGAAGMYGARQMSNGLTSAYNGYQNNRFMDQIQRPQSQYRYTNGIGYSEDQGF